MPRNPKQQKTLAIRGHLRLPCAALEFRINTATKNSQVAQAIVAALYFSNSFADLKKLFLPMFEELASRQRGGSSKNSKLSREEVREMTRQHDPSVAYPSVLQELIQARTTLLPSYSVTSNSIGGKPVEVTARWGSLVVTERGPSKAVGKSRCAFSLLAKLCDEDSFWGEGGL